MPVLSFFAKFFVLVWTDFHITKKGANEVSSEIFAFMHRNNGRPAVEVLEVRHDCLSGGLKQNPDAEEFWPSGLQK